MKGSRRPGGPRGIDVLRAQLDFSRDQIGFFREVHRRYGDVTSFLLGPYDTWMICDPDLIEEMLLRRNDALIKDELTHELEDMLGQGLLTNEGEPWRRQRKLASPMLRPRQIQSYATSMVRLTREMVDGWSDGEVLDFHPAMMDVTARIVVKTLFNLDADEAISSVEQALSDAMHFFHVSAHTMWRFVPEFIPTPAKRRFAEATAQIDDVVYDLIEKRRASGEEGDDLLWRLLEAVDEDGNGMTDEQLRDECITFFTAGHETTALNLSYTWYLLTRHPEAYARLVEEIDTVLEGDDATAADVKRLPYANAVIKESLRLYSPAWIIGREPVEEIELGEWLIPKGAQVLFPQSVVHRDPRWFEKPDDFVPERWLDGTLEAELPRFAYFPFGGGARVCIGNHFAIMEAMLVMATMVQMVELEDRSTEPLETQPSVTLRPITPIKMAVEKR